LCDRNNMWQITFSSPINVFVSLVCLVYAMFKIRKIQMSSFQYILSVPCIYVWNSLNFIPSLSPSQFNFGFHRRDLTQETFKSSMAGLSWYTPYVHWKKLKSTPLLRVSQNHQISVRTFDRSATLLDWMYD
jgi:hypothetical protein